MKKFIGVLLVATAAGWGVGSPSGTVVGPVGEAHSVARFTYRVSTPEVSLQETPHGSVIAIEGFGSHERRPGTPDIPFKTVLVAIPPGAIPTLTFSLEEGEVLPGRRPRPVPRILADVQDPDSSSSESSEDGESSGRDRRRPSFQPDPAFYDRAGRRLAPLPARLGRIGVLRDQRYVEVHLAPVRFDPASGLRVARSLEVTVHFDGIGPGDLSSGQSRPLDPRFEPIYRNAFVNYAQGTTFRMGGADAGGLAASPVQAASSRSASARYRIRVRGNGVVRLDHARMSATGLISEPLSTWKLSDRGVEAPLHVHETGVANDLLDPGEWVQFYGQALDDEPKTVLNTDMPAGVDLHQANDFSDENIYFLTVETGPRARMAARDAAPTLTRTPPADFLATAHREVDDAWRPLDAADPWSWTPTLQTGSGSIQRTDDVPLPGLASGTAAVSLRVQVKSTSENSSLAPDHRSQVTLMNAASQTLATQNDDGTFEGRRMYLHAFGWTYPGAGPAVSDPAKVKLEALPAGAANCSTDQSCHSILLDWIELDYRRLFAASGDTLTFDWPDEDAEFEVSGLSSAAGQLEVYEITDRVGDSGVVEAVRLASVLVTGVGPYTARFRVDQDPALADGTPRRFVVAGSGAVVVPPEADFSADTVSDLRDTTNQADLIVIAHPDVLDDPASCTSSSLTDLLAFRASQGITSKVACIGDVQDEFADGLAGPNAIRSFLRFVLSSAPGEGWADPKPGYVLLLGDGSYDYKGGTAKGNYVPTMLVFKSDPVLGYFASDNVLAAVSGTDNLPDLVVGRISARTVAEADTVLGKILDYEQLAPAGSWRKHALFVSDRGKNFDQAEADEFERMNDVAQSYMKIPPHTSRELRYRTDYGGTDAAGIKQDIKKAVNGTLDAGIDGAAMVQFIGHGNFDLWSDDTIFDKADTASLTNSLRLPWLLAHNCLTGGFHTTAATSLGESWLKRSGGGAVAVLAPSSLSFRYIGEEVTKVVWSDLFGRTKERTVAVPVMDTAVKLCGQGSDEACQAYIFMGDPTMGLHLPAVGPPQGVTATPGNARVDLAWTASSTAGATYDVYRTKDYVLGSYTKLNATPVAGTTYADTSALNATTYYYYVLARDAEGFESRWSNFNSDCAVSGPDCLTARPLNPNPPAPPANVVVTDPETGGKLNLVWTANTEPDFDYYEVHYGTAPGVYTQTLSAQRNTSFSLTGLVNGTPYFIAVTATNTSDLTSPYSIERTGTPTFVRGVKSPAFVASLRLAKSGSDAVLSWDAVTTDIYGKTETVGRYEVYRGTTPDFDPVDANRISPLSLTATTFTDAGALAAAPNYYYLVRAVDAEGNVGGLGRQLPGGIDALRVDRSATTPGNVVLSWPAVTTDFDGKPTRVEFYRIYASGTPFRRSDVRDGSVPLLLTVTGTSIEVTPPAGNQYYSVLVVDDRGNVSSF